MRGLSSCFAIDIDVKCPRAVFESITKHEHIDWLGMIEIKKEASCVGLKEVN